MRFREWLMAHLEEDSAIGDLALNAARDTKWTGHSVKSFEEFLIAYGASSATIEAFEKAKELYRNSRLQ